MNERERACDERWPYRASPWNRGRSTHTSCHTLLAVASLQDTDLGVVSVRDDW